MLKIVVENFTKSYPFFNKTKTKAEIKKILRHSSLWEKATNVYFKGEVSILCGDLDIDVHKVKYKNLFKIHNFENYWSKMLLFISLNRYNY